MTRMPTILSRGGAGVGTTAGAEGAGAAADGGVGDGACAAAGKGAKSAAAASAIRKPLARTRPVRPLETGWKLVGKYTSRLALERAGRPISSRKMEARMRSALSDRRGLPGGDRQ